MIIDGKKVAADLRADLKKKIVELKSNYNAIPGLTVVLVGEDPPSKIYGKNKEKFAKEVGMNSEVIRYPEKVEEKVVLNKIRRFIPTFGAIDVSPIILILFLMFLRNLIFEGFAPGLF